MYAYGISKETIERATFRLGVTVNLEEQPERGRIKFTVKNFQSSNTFRSFNPQPEFGGSTHFWKERRTASVCFHGHYALFKKMFELEGNPEAKIESSWYGKTVYTPETLRERAQEFGMRRKGPEGNIYHVWQLRELCYCALSGPNPEGIY